MDADNADGRAAHVVVEDGDVDSAATAGGDEDVVVAAQVSLDGLRHSALPGGHVGAQEGPIGVRRFVLGFEGEDVLGGVGPLLAGVLVNVAQDVGDALLEVILGIRVGVEVTRAVTLTVVVSVSFKGVEAVDGDIELNTVAVGLNHDVIEAL